MDQLKLNYSVYFSRWAISKIFQGEKKRRDLSNKAETEKYPKNIRKRILDCSQISEVSDVPNGSFTDSLKAWECKDSV